MTHHEKTTCNGDCVLHEEFPCESCFERVNGKPTNESLDKAASHLARGGSLPSRPLRVALGKAFQALQKSIDDMEQEQIEMMRESNATYEQYLKETQARDGRIKELEQQYATLREAIDWAIGKCHKQDAGFNFKIIAGLEKALSPTALP